MIRHPEFTMAAMLDLLKTAEALPDRVDGAATLDERIEAKTALMAALENPAKPIQTICIACEMEATWKDCEPCVCGGFVCPACLAIEGFGACDHEPPQLLDDDL